MAVAGAAAAEVFCHEEHEADQYCAVCQLRHQPAAELSGSLRIGFADVAEPLEQAPDGEVDRVRSFPPPPRPRPARLVPVTRCVSSIVCRRRTLPRAHERARQGNVPVRGRPRFRMASPDTGRRCRVLRPSRVLVS